MSALLDRFESLLQRWRTAFPQGRTFDHAVRLAFGFVTTWGRRTVSRALCTTSDQFQDWSAAYRFFSRAPWNPADLFQSLIDEAVAQTPERTSPFVVAMDDTTLKKTGHKIPGTAFLYDASSPVFARSFRWSQRFIQVSMLLRPEGGEGPARGIPIRFVHCPPAQKPSRRADAAAFQAYREAKQVLRLPVRGSEILRDVRHCVDQAGAAHRTLLCAVDGGYCNRTFLTNLPDRTEVIARARADMRLFAPPDSACEVGRGRHRVYGERLPTPNEMRTDDRIPYQTAQVFASGRVHQLAYKEIAPVLWRSGTRGRPMRLFILRPLRYRLTVRGRLLYRDPAYLLTTDLHTPAEVLLQAYFDRWEIEVNHRDEKDLFGVGQAQVRSPKAVERVPAFQVALYALLLLAALEAYGPRRSEVYLPVPKWRKDEDRRPSTLDILALFREELVQQAIDRRFRQGPALPSKADTSAPKNGRSTPKPTPQKHPVDIHSALLYALA
jgi:hypothetical protein